MTGRRRAEQESADSIINWAPSEEVSTHDHVHGLVKIDHDPFFVDDGDSGY
jgi:hypothetical protein